MEDTAKNILEQEQQRYSHQIEALKLLVFQTHQQALANNQRTASRAYLNGTGPANLLKAAHQQVSGMAGLISHPRAFKPSYDSKIGYSSQGQQTHLNRGVPHSPGWQTAADCPFQLAPANTCNLRSPPCRIGSYTFQYCTSP